MNSVQHLYVHIPFCPKVCPYCSFYKEASDRNKTTAFVHAVLQELEERSQMITMRPRTIFFGGGTPTALPTRLLEELITGIKSRIDCSHLVEWTIEMNPATVSLEKASLLLSLGVTRASMGVQSWHPALLERLGRVHSAEQARRSYDILREAGFENINLDHIFGIPGQTHLQWMETLETTLDLQPEHISAYCLTYEEDTEFFLRFQRGEFLQNDERDAAFLEAAIDLIEPRGFLHYEISNYALPGRECLHNLAYWQGRDYLGLGPSAFSTIGQRRWQNIPDTACYISAMQSEASAISFEETLNATTRLAERIAFGLRTRYGVPVSFLDHCIPEIQALIDNNLLKRHHDSITLTRRGLLLADELAAQLIP